jgi:hypothetical protein
VEREKGKEERGKGERGKGKGEREGKSGKGRGEGEGDRLTILYVKEGFLGCSGHAAQKLITSKKTNTVAKPPEKFENEKPRTVGKKITHVRWYILSEEFSGTGKISVVKVEPPEYKRNPPPPE